MALQAALHNCTDVIIQKYPELANRDSGAFATLEIRDEHKSNLTAFLRDPALARLIAERALEIADFLEEEQAIATAVEAAKEQLQQARAEVDS